LNCLGALLGAIDGPKDNQPNVSKNYARPSVGFWTHLGCQKGAKTDPKTTKNRSKNRLKKRSRFRTVLRPSWVDLGSILAPSCGPKNAPDTTPADVSRESTFSNKSGLKTRLGTILGRFGSPKGVVLGGLLGLSWGKKG